MIDKSLLKREVASFPCSYIVMIYHLGGLIKKLTLRFFFGGGVGALVKEEIDGVG